MMSISIVRRRVMIASISSGSFTESGRISERSSK